MSEGMATVSDARVEWVEEYPKWAVPTVRAPLREPRRRKLTNLYNERPRWWVDAHGAVDAAVAGAYGWLTDISDDVALQKLMRTNSSRLDRSD